MRRLISRIKNEQGFSLTELLASLLIVVLISSLLASGIPVAANAYHSVMDGSNAQVLLSTTTTLLRTELGNAMDISVITSEESTKSLSYIDAQSGEKMVLGNGNNPKGLTLTHADGVTCFPGTASTSKLLVSEKTATNGLYAKYGDINVSSDGKVVTFSNLEIMKDGRTNSLAKLKEFKVRSVVKIK